MTKGNEQLFSQRQPLLKFAPMQCTKGEKASYCLACLISLVEQVRTLRELSFDMARYLQFRNWPVEWGWCRDLQSFIFVFERHNRIVRERPEYGYATYFFEFLDFLPINWQIKHLVTAMKLPSCSRVTLIENKALLEVRVRFIGFGSEEDEWVNVKKAIREHSLPLEHSKCGKLEVGDLVHLILQHCYEAGLHLNFNCYCLVHEVSYSSETNIQEGSRYFPTLFSCSPLLCAVSFDSPCFRCDGGSLDIFAMS